MVYFPLRGAYSRSAMRGPLPRHGSSLRKTTIRRTGRMGFRARLFTVGLGFVAILLSSVAAEAARPGRLSGVVRDQAGAPLVGATIAIFDAVSRSEDPVRNALTDD